MEHWATPSEHPTDFSKQHHQPWTLSDPDVPGFDASITLDALSLGFADNTQAFEEPTTDSNLSPTPSVSNSNQDDQQSRSSTDNQPSAPPNPSTSQSSLPAPSNCDQPTIQQPSSSSLSHSPPSTLKDHPAALQFSPSSDPSQIRPPPQTSWSAPLPPISKMAPAPQPAEKSRAGRKARAAIQGGGGLGAKGSRSSVFEQVISRTRPKYLPPKGLMEDQKHLKEFNEMMAASLELQKRKDQLETEKKLAREKLLASYQSTWEKEVLPNWKSVLRDDASGKALCKMWWLGTMPPRHRGRLWHQCIGNAGAVGRSAFTKSVALANSLINSEPSRFLAETLKSIDDDIAITLPKLKLFQEGGAMHHEFRELLLAWSVFWREKPYYPIGSSHVAAMFLINMPPADAFLSLVNITRKSCLSYFYNNRQAEVEAFCRIFETLLAERMPKIFRNFERRRVRPEIYLRPWLRSLYAAHLPIQLATRIMDVFVLEGDSFLFRVALAMLQILEARLLNPDKEEVEMVFRGEDRGARAIVARDTMSVYGERNLDQVAAEEAYEEMGCTEEHLFDILDHLSWNEPLWERLVSRELPD